MKSIRYVTREYRKLLDDVKSKDFYKKDLSNRVNCYVCEKGHITKTKDIAAGVTPFLYQCEICGEVARSSFYKDIAPQKEPTQEWYRPCLKEVLKRRKNEYELEHILKGGLIPRKILTNKNNNYGKNFNSLSKGTIRNE